MPTQVIKNAELYFSRLDKAVENPFGQVCYETQVGTSDEAKVNCGRIWILM